MTGIFDVTQLTGPVGGLLAIAYAAGAASGYAFCLRTMYKIIKAQAEKDEADWKERVEKLERELGEARGEIRILQERQFHGMERQQAQIRDSTVHILGREKLGRRTDDEL